MKAKRAVVALSVASVVGLAPVAAMARNGADDPAGHDARDDRVRTTVVDRRGHHDPRRDDHVRSAVLGVNDRGRGGHDDPAGDDHSRHRHHDGLRSTASDRSRESEPGDDRGREAEPNDDRNMTEPEPGDDHGNHAEPGDDRGGHTAEAGDHVGHGGEHESGDDHGGR